MMRPATLILFALAGAAGATLFGVAYKVSEMEEHLSALNKEIKQDREAIHVLRAEWSYLNQPERLEGLSRRYLDLQPLEGEQMADVASLPQRPAPVPTADAEPSEAAPGAGAAVDAQAPGPALAGALAARPKAKPAAPRRPSGQVQLAAQPAPARPATDPETAALNASLRAILGPAASNGRRRR